MNWQFKVMGVGLPKTGTTTLHRALQSAGYATVHQAAGWRLPHAGELMWQAFGEHLPISTYLPLVDGVTQLDNCGKGRHVWPQFEMMFMYQLCQENPDMKVILHTRSPMKTFRSMLHWGDFYLRLLKSAPGIDIHATPVDFERWMTDYYERIEQWMLSWSMSFLKFDIEDPAAKEKLEVFLGRKVKWWGVENKWAPGVKG